MISSIAIRLLFQLCTMSREMHEVVGGETVSSLESRDVLELAATNAGWQAEHGKLPEFEFWNRQTRFWNNFRQNMFSVAQGYNVLSDFISCQIFSECHPRHPCWPAWLKHSLVFSSLLSRLLPRPFCRDWQGGNTAFSKTPAAQRLLTVKCKKLNLHT